MTARDALSEAVDLLPRWVPWAQTAALVGAFATALLIGALGIWIAARPLARVRDAHWTERARHVQMLLWPRILPCLWLWLCACIVLGGTGRSLSAVPEMLLELGWLAAPFAALFLLARLVRRIAFAERWPIATWLRECALWMCAVYAPMPLALVVWTTAHRSDAPGRTAILVVASVLYVAALVGGGTWVARRVGLSRRAPDSLRAIAEHWGPRVGARLHAIDVFPSRMANAIAFPVIGRIAVTTRALEVLDDAQLEGVVLHELGHLAEPRHWLVRRLLPGALLLLLLLAPVWLAISHVQQLLAAFALFLLVIAERRFRRRAEERADRTAGEHVDSSHAYARALERLHEANLAPAVMGPGFVHPHLYDRMVAAGATPDYERPAPPLFVRSRIQSAATLALLAVPIVWFSLSVGDLGEETASDAELHWRIALDSQPSYWVDALARQRFDEQRLDESAALFRAAAELAPEEPITAAGLAITEARRLDVPAARTALAEAERRAASGEVDVYVSAALDTARAAIRWAERQPPRH